MQFVIPAVILGTAYVAGKVFEFAGEYEKAQTLKEVADNVPQMTLEMCKSSMNALNDYIGLSTPE